MKGFVRCPSCPTQLQALSPDSTYPQRACDIVKERLDLELPGPAIIYPLGPLIVHHDIAHHGLDLAKYLEAHYDGRTYP